MTDKEIEQALKDMALTTNWGSVERVGATNSDVNGVPKNIAIIQETLAYIDRLKAENEKIRKETAKEILLNLRRDISQCFGEYALDVVDEYIERYGVKTMKEMIYSEELKVNPEVLYDGIYKDHKFAILNLGAYPTAYVENKLHNIDDYEDERLYGIKVHGGFTYLDTADWNDTDSYYYLGWDYAHAGDYGTYRGGKKYTTQEIYDEVKSVIDQLIEVENRGE